MLFEHNITIRRIITDRIVLILLAVSILTILTGCDNPDYQGKNYTINSYDDFKKALDDRGYSVKEDDSGQKKDESLFPISPHVFILNGTTVSVYAFKDAEEAKSEAGKISEGGYSINGKRMDWKSAPHFFQKGNIIVGFVGGDDELFFDMSMIMGKSVAG